MILHAVAATAFLLASAFSRAASRDVVPQDRRTDWIPGFTVGVPGGIPHRTLILSLRRVWSTNLIYPGFPQGTGISTELTHLCRQVGMPPRCPP